MLTCFLQSEYYVRLSVWSTNEWRAVIRVNALKWRWEDEDWRDFSRWISEPQKNKRTTCVPVQFFPSGGLNLRFVDSSIRRRRLQCLVWFWVNCWYFCFVATISFPRILLLLPDSLQQRSFNSWPDWEGQSIWVEANNVEINYRGDWIVVQPGIELKSRVRSSSDTWIAKIWKLGPTIFAFNLLGQSSNALQLNSNFPGNF